MTNDAVCSITPHHALKGQTIVMPNCFGMQLKGLLSAHVNDYCQSCLIITKQFTPNNSWGYFSIRMYTYTCLSVFSYSDDGEDGGEISDREILGKKKRGPKKKKETKKKDKDGKTTKAHKRKKIVCII